MKEIITKLKLLETPSEPLTFITDQGFDMDEGKAIIEELKEVLNNSSDIIALAAPQIGINKRIFCIKFADVIKTFINPIITKKTGTQVAPETFSSMPGKEILISRPTEITAVYYNEDFKYEDNKFLDEAARIFDQQCQLLDGVLPGELGLVSDVKRDGSLKKLSEEEMQKLIDMYKQYITLKSQAAEQEIKGNEEVHNQYKQLKFAEDVINGRTQVVADNPGAKLNRAQRRQAAKTAKKINKNQKPKEELQCSENI